MAKTNRNFLTHNYSGKVGKQYSLRNRSDQPIIAGLPKPKSVDAATQHIQLEIQRKFHLAVIADDSPCKVLDSHKIGESHWRYYWVYHNSF